MKKIRRNAEKKIKSILTTATLVKVYTHKNNYQGQEVELTSQEINSAVSDIKEGFAIMMQVDHKTHHIKYAGECYWELIA